MTDETCYCGHTREQHAECGCCDVPGCGREVDGDWYWCVFDPTSTWEEAWGLDDDEARVP